MLSTHVAFLSLLVSNPSSVDLIRQALQTKSDRWFFWLVVSSLVVGVGVLFEAWEATVALKRWYRHWKGRPVEPENEKSFAIPLSYLGLFIVIIGVGGEGVFEFLSANVETALRSHDEQILGATESKFGQIKDSAESAAGAARQAEASASTADRFLREASFKSAEAVISAGNAVNLAKSAGQEADSFEKEIASANKTATEAEKHLAEALQEAGKAEAELNRIRSPRSLANEQALITALSPFRGTEYTLKVAMDDESLRFITALAGALDAAGWVRKQPTVMHLGVPTFNVAFKQGSTEIVPSCFDTGISLDAYAKESLSTLQALPFQSLPKTLQAAIVLRSAIASSISPPDERNVEIGILDPHPGDGIPMTICVGKKP